MSIRRIPLFGTIAMTSAPVAGAGRFPLFDSLPPW